MFQEPAMAGEHQGGQTGERDACPEKHSFDGPGSFRHERHGNCGERRNEAGLLGIDRQNECQHCKFQQVPSSRRAKRKQNAAQAQRNREHVNPHEHGPDNDRLVTEDTQSRDGSGNNGHDPRSAGNCLVG